MLPSAHNPPPLVNPASIVSLRSTATNLANTDAHLATSVEAFGLSSRPDGGTSHSSNPHHLPYAPSILNNSPPSASNRLHVLHHLPINLHRLVFYHQPRPPQALTATRDWPVHFPRDSRPRLWAGRRRHRRLRRGQASGSSFAIEQIDQYDHPHHQPNVDHCHRFTKSHCHFSSSDKEHQEI